MAACLAVACAKDTEDEIFTDVILNVSLPDGGNVVTLEIDPDLPGNRFSNINTGISYPFPVIVNNSGSLRVQKGVYMISFDGEAMLEDGTKKTVRFSEWGTPSTSVELMESVSVLELKLSVMR